MTDTCPTSAGGVATFQFANLAGLGGLRLLDGLVDRLLLLNCRSRLVLYGFLELGHSGALSRNRRGGLGLGLSLGGFGALGRGFGRGLGRSLGLSLLDWLFGLGLVLDVVVGGAATQSECGNVARERCAKSSTYTTSLTLSTAAAATAAGLLPPFLVFFFPPFLGMIVSS